MPRKKTPTLRRHKASGHAYANLDGRQEWFGRYDDPATHQRFAERLALWRVGGRLPAPGEDRTTTVADLAARFLEHAEEYYRYADGRQTTTVGSYVYALRPLLGLFATLRAAEVTAQHLKLVREAMLDAELSRTTINNRVTLLIRVFKWGTEEGLLPGGVFQALEALRPLQRGRSRAHEPTPRRPVAWETVEACLPHLSRQVVGIVELMWWSGMRPAEAVALRPADIERGGALWTYRPRRRRRRRGEGPCRRGSGSPAVRRSSRFRCPLG